jgi:hypothetical protein
MSVSGPKPLRIHFAPYEGGQREFWESDALIKVAFGAPQSGKTTAAAAECCKWLFHKPPEPRNWLVVLADYQREDLAVFRELGRLLELAPLEVRKNQARHRWRLPETDWSIYFRSGRDPSNITSVPAAGIWVDEPALLPRKTWTNILSRILATSGPIILSGTREGQNWYLRFVKQVKKGEIPRAQMFTMRVRDNPEVTQETLNLVSSQMTPREVMEYLDEKADLYAGEVITSLDAVEMGSWENPVPGRKYSCGMDVAKKRNLSVLSVMDEDRRHLVHQAVMIKEGRGLSYREQVHEVVRVTRLYNGAYVLADRGGVGEPFIEMLWDAGVFVEGFDTQSEPLRQALLAQLAFDIEREQMTFPYDPDLHDEVLSLEYAERRAGKVKYAFPKDAPTDRAFALALAGWATRRFARSKDVEARIEPVRVETWRPGQPVTRDVLDSLLKHGIRPGGHSKMSNLYWAGRS